MSARSFRRARARRIRKQGAIAAGAGLGATVLFAPVAEAATFTVTSPTDDGTGTTLREAIESANLTTEADEVVFQAGLTGTITLEGASGGQIEITEPLAITGPGASAIAVSGDDTFRIFYADTAETLSISGLTLRDGYANGTNGAALYAGDADTTLAGMVFTQNYAGASGGDGGAVQVDAANMSISGSQFTANSAAESGGALYGAASSDFTVTISDSTFADNEAGTGGGNPYDGGALYGDGNFVITNSTFTGNSADGYGGALYTSGGTTISGSTFAGNEAGDSGGAVYLSDGSLKVTGSSFTGNSAGDYAGAVYVDDTAGNDPVEVSISDSVFTGNQTTDGTGDGGAIYVANADAGMEFRRLTIANNTSTEDAGGLSINSASTEPVTISDSTFSGNTAENAAGGLWILGPGGPVTIQNSTFHGNTAYYGGGISSSNTQDVPVTIRNSTITGNRAVGSGGDGGGGVYRYGDGANPGDDTVTLSSSIVAQNTSATTGPDLGEDQDNANTGAFNVDHSLIGSTAGANVVESPAGSNLIGVDPLLGPLADNGGPTQTRVPALNSPAVDAGIANGLANDQRGLARTAELSSVPNRPGSDGTDIGAVEIQTASCQGKLVASKRGTEGDDTITGADTPDALFGLGGKDRVSALGGKDCADGGAGRDRVNGGKGKDKVKGGAGRDFVKGGKGKDKLKGNAGKDKLKAADGKKDKVNCGGGKDEATVDAKDKVAKNCDEVTVRGR